MLKFLVYDEGKPASQWTVRNAHLVGADRSAMRGDVTFEQGVLLCHKREVGTASLVVQRHVGDCGELSLSTCLLPDRAEPYSLSLEQARHRLMLVYNKLEEWGMFDLSEEHTVHRRIEKAKKLFIEALCVSNGDMAAADKLAMECLVAGIDASEELAVAHADLLLARRKAVGLLPKHAVGCGVSPEISNERVRAGLAANFDFIQLPMAWKELEPKEGDYKWAPLDQWAEWSAKHKVPILAGPLISFDPRSLPDWAYIWEHDYDTVRELLYEHTQRVVNRYKHVVGAWNVVAGLHVNSHMAFGFDQLMDLTRMGAMLVKKLHPTAKLFVEVREPFGEYYGTNQRSIPPLTYADLLIQGAVVFDALAIRLLMGQPSSGQYTRDLMQISNLLDQFSVFGKPLHLTIGAPSEPVVGDGEGGEAKPADDNCGYWRKPWSPLVQSRWLEAVFHIALSKPFVETVAWNELMDHGHAELPFSGLISPDLAPKPAYRRMVAFKKSLSAPSGPGSAPVGLMPPDSGAAQDISAG